MLDRFADGALREEQDGRVRVRPVQQGEELEKPVPHSVEIAGQSAFPPRVPDVSVLAVAFQLQELFVRGVRSEMDELAEVRHLGHGPNQDCVIFVC